jgi:ubiquinone/menaquinone biosynthesis C-methylase UbiE
MSTTTSDLNLHEASPEPYPETLVTMLQLVWGQGFLSPGGPQAVARILEGLNITGQDVLDLGCGIGGPSIELVKTFKAKQVVGLDVDRGNLRRAKQAVASASLEKYILFQLIQLGVLPLKDASFDIVFSKDALVEAHDKETLFAEAFRVLRPGGWFVASDWLRADGPISASLQRWVDFTATGDAPHSFHLASLSETAESLETLGFANIEVRNQNAWYREEARQELGRKTGEFWPQLLALRGKEGAHQSVQWHQAMIEVLDSGDFCPSNFRAQRPKSN